MIFSTCRTVSSDWLSIAGGVSPPICGVAMTFGKLCQFRRRHLVQRAADIHRGAGDAVLAQCRRQRGLVDEIAARQVDEEGMRLHARQRRLPDQIFGLLVGDREADDKIGSCQQIVERHMLEVLFADGRKGIGDQNFHAQAPWRSAAR